MDVVVRRKLIPCSCKKSNLHYTGGIIPNCNEWRDHLRDLAPEQHSSKETSQQLRVIGDITSGLTSPKIEPTDISHRCIRPLRQKTIVKRNVSCRVQATSLKSHCIKFCSIKLSFHNQTTHRHIQSVTIQETEYGLRCDSDRRYDE